MPDRRPLYESILTREIGGKIQLKSFRLIGSGGYNQAVCLGSGDRLFFLKINQEENVDVFEKEQQGLDLLRKHTFLQIPEVYGRGRIEGENYLLLEWLEEGRPVDDYWEQLGRGLAELHGTSAAEFGLDQDNYISILPQANQQCQRWTDFFIENRLEKMLQIALTNGVLEKRFADEFRQIYSRIPHLFPVEEPALLHGDLWSGNVMVSGLGKPCLIDPAVYYGHREMDLAFSKLFGGFNERFYTAYQEAFPIERGFEERKNLYNLYPLLVHLNLFGTSYLASIKNVIKKYIG